MAAKNPMKFSEWLEKKNEGVFDSKTAKATAGWFVGGPVGAAIGYSMGDKKKSPIPNDRYGAASRAARHMADAEEEGKRIDAEREKKRSEMKAKGMTDLQIFQAEKEQYEKERKHREELTRRDQLGFVSRAKEDLFGMRMRK